MKDKHNILKEVYREKMKELNDFMGSHFWDVQGYLPVQPEWQG